MANFRPNQNEYKNMTPFKTWLKYQINTWGLNSFPFVESDFDDLTNYAMMMKLMKHFNVLIENQNMVEEDMTKLYNAFTELQNYVNLYFDVNLPQLVNDKLDEMAEDGTLENLLNNNAHLIKVYNTYNDMILDSTNFTNGLRLKTMGYYSINDGGNAEYFVNNEVNTNYYQIELENSLYLNLIVKDNINIKTIGAYGDNTHDDTTAIQSAINYSAITKKTIFMPVGTYLVRGLTITSTDCHIVGENIKQTIIKVLDSNYINDDGIIYVSDLGIVRLHLENFSLDGNKDNHNLELNGLLIRNTNYSGDSFLNLFNLRIYNCSKNGLILTGITDGIKEARVNNCLLYDNTFNGLYTARCSDSIFLQNTAFTNGRSGFRYSGSNLKVLQNKAFLNGKGIESSTELEPEYRRPDNTHTYFLRYAGFYLDLQRSLIANCESQDNWGDGFLFLNANTNSLENVNGDSNGILIDNNGDIVSYESLGLSQLYYGVYCYNVPNIKINGIFDNFRYSTSNYKHQKGALCINNCNNIIANVIANNQVENYTNINTPNCDIEVNYNKQPYYYDLDSLSILEGYTLQKTNSYIKKIANHIFIRLAFSKPTYIPTSEDQVTLTTLPANYRPNVIHFTQGLLADNSAYYSDAFCSVYIGNDGKLYFRGNSNYTNKQILSVITDFYTN